MRGMGKKRPKKMTERNYILEGWMWCQPWRPSIILVTQISFSASIRTDKY